MIDHFHSSGRSVYAFLERVLPAATLLLAILIVTSGASLAALATLCAVHIAINVSMSRWISGLEAERRPRAEGAKNGVNLLYIAAATVAMGPGTYLWTLHLLPILRSMVAFTDRAGRLGTAVALGASASLAELWARAPVSLALEPLILLVAPALILESLFRFSDEVLQQEHEQRLQAERAQRLSNRMEAVGNLASGLAHEINTPIQYVGDSLTFVRSGMLDLLAYLEEVEGGFREAARHSPKGQERLAAVARAQTILDLPFLTEELPIALDRMRSGLGRVADLVHSIKWFSHPGDAEPHYEDLNAAIETTVRVAATACRQEIDLRLGLNPLPPVFCRVGELNQVLLNLVVNAADAIRAKGTQAQGVIEVESHHRGDAVHLIVSDNGEGIAPELLERVFDPFFTTKRPGEGTGQGLAIAHNVVERRHGGSIQITSRPGLGTTVCLILPIEGREDCDEDPHELAQQFRQQPLGSPTRPLTVPTGPGRI